MSPFLYYYLFAYVLQCLSIFYILFGCRVILMISIFYKEIIKKSLFTQKRRFIKIKSFAHARYKRHLNCHKHTLWSLTGEFMNYRIEISAVSS